jgi:DNA-binding transcriptional LysR family regulator
MDLLASFRTFVRIAETGSFSAVARESGTTQPAISRQIAALEEHLGVRLLQRTTRSLRLSEDGQELLGRARLLIEAVDETEAMFGRRRETPSGLVRLGCPSVFGRTYIVPHVGTLLARHPDLSVEVIVADDVVDMVQEGLDISIRVGEVRDTSMVARRIGSTTSLPVASAAYLDAHGEPTHPSELASHSCVIFTRLPSPGTWILTGPEGPVTVAVSGRLRTNSIESVLAGVLAGHGIALVPLWMMRDPLGAGIVRPILRAWRSRVTPISAVYPSRRFLAPRTRAVIDFLIQEFHADPVISAHGEGRPD